MGSTGSAQVSIKGVKKSYENGTHVVKGIDLEIAKHEFVVLVGPSGLKRQRRGGLGIER